MATGTIKTLIRDRGFGFIAAEDGTEIFFHRSDLVGMEMEQLSEGQQVEFEVGRGPKGPRAERVRTAG